MQSRHLISIICVLSVLIATQNTAAQTKRCLIPLPERSVHDTDDEVSLELIEIKIDGKPIAPDTPFDTDAAWLKNLTLRVKNIGTKPIVGSVLVVACFTALARNYSRARALSTGSHGTGEISI